MVRSTDRRDDPPMDLPTAFEHALPSAGWPFAGGQGTLAVFIAADAWSRWNAEAFALLDVDERERVLRKRRPDDRALTTLA
jgi:hypothetical protein